MTSSQPVVTQNAINFTPDNLRAYSYSGLVTTSASDDVNLLEFSTNSEYIRARIQFWYDAAGSGSNIEFKTFFNTVKVATTHVTDSIDVEWQLTYLIIPPFTDVLIQAKNHSSSTEPVLCTLTGDVYGMIETGYQ